MEESKVPVIALHCRCPQCGEVARLDLELITRMLIDLGRHFKVSHRGVCRFVDGVYSAAADEKETRQ